MSQNNNNMQNIQSNNNVNNNKNEFNSSREISSENNYSFSRYTKPAKTRLKDLSDTSYLNSVLFSLGNIRNIVSYFLNPDNFNVIDTNIKSMSLCFVFERLLYHLYEKDNTEENCYSPEAFWKVLCHFNIVYKTLQRRNPIELINYLLNMLHNELNKVNKLVNIEGVDKKDKMKVIKAGVKKFQSSNNTIISNNLNWFEIKDCSCQKCKNTTFEFLTFITLNLDLESTQNQFNNKNQITIYDCLKNYNEPKMMNIFCQFCNSNENIICKSKIFLTSHALIFCMNRDIDFSEKNKLLKIKFNLEEKIELSSFIEESRSPKKYHLMGIISIFLPEKRYVNFSESPVDKKWYYYNNEKKVEDINLEEVLQRHNKDGNEYIPTILIYKASL